MRRGTQLVNGGLRGRGEGGVLGFVVVAAVVLFFVLFSYA